MNKQKIKQLVKKHGTVYLWIKTSSVTGNGRYRKLTTTGCEYFPYYRGEPHSEWDLYRKSCFADGTTKIDSILERMQEYDAEFGYVILGAKVKTKTGFKTVWRAEAC